MSRLRLKTLVLSISYMCYFAKVNKNLSIHYCIIPPIDIFWHILVVTEIKMKQIFSLINSKKGEKKLI